MFVNRNAPMLINRKTPVFISLIVASVVFSFAASGGMAAIWLWTWLGLAIWLRLDKPAWPKDALPNLMLGFLLWITVSVWWSHSPYSSWYAVLVLGAIPISFIAWLLTPNPDEIWKRFEKVFVAGVWIVSLWGVYQVAFLGFPRALGPLADPNVYACLLNLAWFPLLSAFFNSNSTKLEKSCFTQLILGVSLLLVGLAFFAAASRGATLTWILLMPLALWAFRRQPNFPKHAFLSLSIALASYFIVSAITHAGLSDRVSVEVMQDASVTLRLLIWRTTLDMFAASPWLGTGLGTWSGIYPAYRPAEDNITAGYFAHNDYLQIAQEGGVITFILFMLIFLSLVSLFIRFLFTSKQHAIHVENTGLMLGVMAAYLHASVNFIFYLIYLNILIGLFAARIWQSSTEPKLMGFTWSNSFGPVFRRIVLLFFLAIPITQIVLHEASETFLNGHSRSLTLLRKLFPQLTPYDVAWFVAAVRPNEYIAQRYIVDSAAQTLDAIEPGDVLLKQEILAETIERYDELRRNATNSAELGAAEANLILKYRDLVPANSAIQLARSVALAALKDDPRQVDSIIALAGTYFLEGNSSVGYGVLSDGISKMTFLRDRLILQAELLKHHVSAKDKLDGIQKNLRGIKFACKIGDCLENKSIEEDQRAKLHDLAISIIPISDEVIKSALDSLISRQERL